MPELEKNVETAAEKADTAEEQTTQEDIATVKQQLESIQTEKASLEEKLRQQEERAKAEQRNVSKKEQELQKYRDMRAELDSVTKRNDVMLEMLADLVDRMEGEEEPPKRRRSEDYLAKLKREEPKQQTITPPEVMEADRMVRQAGLDWASSPELATAQFHFMYGRNDEGLEEVRRVIGEKKPVETPKGKSIDELSDEEMEEIARKWQAKKGNLISDKGKDSAAVTSRGTLWERAARGQLSEEELRKHNLI